MNNAIGASQQKINEYRTQGHMVGRGLRCDALILALITLLAATLRLLYLTSKSFNLDEGLSLFLAHTDLASFRHFVSSVEMNMVLYYALLRVWVHIGTSEFVVRLLSVIPAVATVPVLYAIGTRLAGRRTGTIAALLLAVHPTHVEFSQEARSYAWAVLLVCLSSFYYLRCLDRPSRSNLLGYALVSALAVYAHVFAGLVLVAQWTAALAFLDQKTVPWRKLAISGVSIGLLLVPAVAAILHASGRGYVGWIPKQSFRDLVDLLYSLALPRSRCLLYVFFWGAAVWGGIRSQSERGRPALVACWLFVPVAITIAVSLYKPLLVPRYLLVCVPAAVLLAADGVTRLNRIAAAILLGLAIIYSISGDRFYCRHPQLTEDWRGASRHVLARFSPNDFVVLLPPFSKFTFDYYRRIAGVPDGSVVECGSSAETLPTSRRTVWFLASGAIEPQLGQTELDTFLAQAKGSYCVAESRNFYGVKLWRLQPCSGFE